MKNNLLLTTALVAMGFVASANALEYTPYVSAKLTYGKVKTDFVQPGIGGTGGADPKLWIRRANHADIEDNVLGGNMAVGVSKPLSYGAVRGEIEFGYKSMKDNYTNSTHPSFDSTADASMEADITTFMFNGYYDFDTGTKLTPYIGAGVGLAKIDMKNKYYDKNVTLGMFTDKSVNNLAWQLSAGAAYALTDNLSLDLSYRYTDLGTLDFFHMTQQSPSFAWATEEYESHEVMLGVRYKF